MILTVLKRVLLHLGLSLCYLILGTVAVFILTALALALATLFSTPGALFALLLVGLATALISLGREIWDSFRKKT